MNHFTCSRSGSTPRPGSQQRGAALVVGMILLLILTLLAISGMTTSTTELIMAGNEEYHENAFQAAETGIERTIAAGTFDVAAEVVNPPVTLPNQDTYATTVRPRGAGLPPPGYSLDQFSAENFEIESAGTSVRNASDTHIQGLFLITPKATQP